MPGLKLDFLKNPAQRVATGKSLPLKQVEAIVLYGRPEQRAKVVEKLLPSTYGLSLNKTTHHILITLLDHCDNLSRTQMLYHVRRKLRDLCSSPVGNSVLQHMIEKLPLRQRKEIAESFVLNVEKDEFKLMCEHPFGNHVAQKLMEYPECVEVVAPNFVPYLKQLATHEYGMRVVAKYIDSNEEGWKQVMTALFPQAPLDEEDEISDSVSEAIDKAVAKLFRSQKESMVVSSLMRHMMVPACLKDAICAYLCEYVEDCLDPRSAHEKRKAVAAAKGETGKKDKMVEDEEEFGLPDFGTASSAPSTAKRTASGDDFAVTHVFAFAAVFEYGDEAQRHELWAAIESFPNVLAAITRERAAVGVAVAAAKFHEECRDAMYKALFTPSSEAATDNGNAKKKGSSKSLTTVEVSCDPVRTMVLRCFIEVDVKRVIKAQRDELVKEAVELSKNPVASPVLQKLVEADASGSCASSIYAQLKKDLPELARHASASFLIQSLLQFGSATVRESLVKDLLEVFSDLHEALSYAQGSRVVQKMLAYAPDEAIVSIVNILISKAEAEDSGDATEEDEEEESDDAHSALEEEDEEGDEADEGKEDQEEKNKKEPRTMSFKEQREYNRTRHYDIATNALFSYALHNHACFVIQALLRETRSRQLDRERRLLMNELKPHVFDLAVSPWAGRLVLEAMMQVGSSKLTEAMKNVVFLRAESWLSDVSEDRKKRGSGVDPTLRNILKRQRVDLKAGKETYSTTETKADKATEPAKKKKRIFRSLKR